MASDVWGDLLEHHVNFTHQIQQGAFRFGAHVVDMGAFTVPRLGGHHQHRVGDIADMDEVPRLQTVTKDGGCLTRKREFDELRHDRRVRTVGPLTGPVDVEESQRHGFHTGFFGLEHLVFAASFVIVFGCKNSCQVLPRPSAGKTALLLLLLLVTLGFLLGSTNHPFLYFQF